MELFSAVLTDAPVDENELWRVFCGQHLMAGALAAFCGRVRPEGKAGPLEQLCLDIYPGMTEASLKVIAGDVAARFSLSGLDITHRWGSLRPGEAIVMVMAAARHRRAAFEAVDYAMDRLKSDLVMWKCEIGPGYRQWIEPGVRDLQDKERWA